MSNETIMRRLVAKDTVPPGTFWGGDEIPAGTFHGKDKIPAGTFHQM